MSAQVDTGLVLKEFQPITEAEAELAVRRLGEDDESRPLEDIVAEVKAERVGPAARWEDEYVAPTPAAEDQTGVPPEPDDDDQLEGWVRTIVDGADDEVAVWLDEHTVDQVVDAVSSTPEDLRPLAAGRVADAEQARGEDARTTLLDRLAKFTGEEA